MDIIGIIVIIFCVLVVGGVVVNHFYRKIKHLPTGDCACCSKKGKNQKNKLLEDYHRKYKNKCDCNKN